MQTVEQVLGTIRQQVAPVAAAVVKLNDCFGAILAEPVRMKEDSPPFDRTLVDGFAIASTANSPTESGTTLQLIGHIDAGSPPFTKTLQPGECVAINTGAPIPPGTDRIAMVEHTEKTEKVESTIRLTRPVPPSFGIQRRAADAAAGITVLRPGTHLDAPALAIAATAGSGELSVRRLRLALLTTGDELVPPSTPTLAPGQIRNSNHPMLHSLLLEFHPEHLLDLGTCPDDRALLREKLARALDTSDLLIVSGGMSMGTRDLVPPLLKDLGVHIHVEKVLMKPGKPFIFGTHATRNSPSPTCVAGLPANPVSSFVTFHRFVRPLIHALLGIPETPSTLQALTDSSLPANGDREFYQPCTLRSDNGQLLATPLAWRGSADVFTLSRANALLIRPVNAPATPAKTPVSILPLRFPAVDPTPS